MDSASAVARAAAAWPRDRGRFADALSAALRRSTSVPGISARGKRHADLLVRRGNENANPSVRWLEKNLRSDAAGGELQCFESATHAALVQFALRAENDRDWPATGRFWQTEAARQTSVYGSSGV